MLLSSRLTFRTVLLHFSIPLLVNLAMLLLLGISDIKSPTVDANGYRWNNLLLSTSIRS